MITSGADSIALTSAFDCSLQRLWRAITHAEELSAWLGGECSIDARVGGNVLFDLSDEGIHARGTVRQVAEPRPDRRVALIEHTFVDSADAEITSICRWALRDTPTGCELVFTHDGFGEAGRARWEAWWRTGLESSERRIAARPTTPQSAAVALLRAARRILLVSFIGPEVPETLLSAGFEVFAKTGPEPDAWARCRRDLGELVFEPCTTPLNDIDLVHLDVSDAFEEYLEVAHSLGARTFWFHSARTCPPQPHDDRGCWLPAAQSARQRDAAEALGMEYVDDHYIADVVRALPG
ncbi:MAG TPA: SRPBCC domain-containing protein [Pseudomonadales bacterium]|nr:SRPBCC domain-containing protein [Pseudomonadales bacterium]